LEGTWVGLCKPVLNQYNQTTLGFVGNTFTGETDTYSDSACSVRASGNDFYVGGTFTTVDEGIIDGKQLTKINWNGQVNKAEGFVALFLPSGAAYVGSSAWYFDGNVMYNTDGDSDILGDGSYASATQIEYDDYLTRQ
jgi:hypothetical protein